jgi:hypothetical protein
MQREKVNEFTCEKHTCNTREKQHTCNFREADHSPSELLKIAVELEIHQEDVVGSGLSIAKQRLHLRSVADQGLGTTATMSVLFPAGADLLQK